jgi:NAD(P)H-dependent FMN reductase
MYRIGILVASVRTGRNSNRVALYFSSLIAERKIGDVTILDLAEYDFPIFHERLQFTTSPSAQVLDFTEKIKSVDGLIIVTPEYNGGYPASLKNVVDLLYQEWYRKPIAISTVSDGNFGGSQVLTSLQFSLWKIRAWTVPAMFPVPRVREAFSEEGVPADKAATDKRAGRFLDELVWCMEASRRMRD